MAEIKFQISPLWLNQYVLLKNNSDLILWEEQDDTAFKILKERLINLPAFEHPNYQIPFFLNVYEKEGNALRVLTQKHGDNHRSITYYSTNWTLWHEDISCLGAITATVLWLCPPRKPL